MSEIEKDETFLNDVVQENAEPVHTAGEYEVYLNPIANRELWIGANGEDYIDNYLIINTTYLTIESRQEDLFTAKRIANKMNGMLEDNMDIYVSDPVAKQLVKSMLSGGLVMAGAEGAGQTQGSGVGTVLTGGGKNKAN